MPDTLVPDPSNLFDYNRYMYTRGNPMKYTDPTGHCIAQGQTGWDSQENTRCYGSAHNIASLGGLDYIQKYFGGYDSVEQWLDTALSDPNLDSAFLTPHADPLHQQWCAGAGLTGQGGCGGTYVENPAPPSSHKALLDELLTACPATFQGVCGASTGVNGAWAFVGGRGSLDAYLDDKGNRLYTWTAAIGPQLALRPLPRVSGSNSYILASAAKLDDFTGPAISLGGSGSFKRGAGGDVIIGSNGIIGYSFSIQSGYNAEVHASVSYSGVIYDSRR